MQPPQNPEHKNANTKCPACHTDGTCSGYDHQTIPCRCRCAVPANDMDLQASVTPKLQSGIHPEHTPVCEKHKDCHLMISSAKECFWPPCVRVGCHINPQRVDWREEFTELFRKSVYRDDMDELEAFIAKVEANAIAETREAVLQKAAHLMDDEGAKTGDILTDEATLRTRNFYHAADMIRALLNNLKEDV